jgi:superfamily II RNA helicase
MNSKITDMKKKLTQGEINKLKVLKHKRQKLETELAEYMENYIEPMEEKIEELRKQIDKIELE